MLRAGVLLDVVLGLSLLSIQYGGSLGLHLEQEWRPLVIFGFVLTSLSIMLLVRQYQQHRVLQEKLYGVAATLASLSMLAEAVHDHHANAWIDTTGVILWIGTASIMGLFTLLYCLSMLERLARRRTLAQGLSS